MRPISPAGKIALLIELMKPSKEGEEPILTPEEAFKLLFGGEVVELRGPEENTEKFANEED